VWLSISGKCLQVYHLALFLSTFLLSCYADTIDICHLTGVAIGAITPLKPKKVTFFTMICSIQKCTYCHLRLTCQILLKLPPLNLRAGSTPASNQLILQIFCLRLNLWCWFYHLSQGGNFIIWPSPCGSRINGTTAFVCAVHFIFFEVKYVLKWCRSTDENNISMWISGWSD